MWVMMKAQKNLLTLPQFQRSGVEFAFAQSGEMVAKTLSGNRYSRDRFERPDRFQNERDGVSPPIRMKPDQRVGGPVGWKRKRPTFVGKT
jgi:hypothetical protein